MWNGPSLRYTLAIVMCLQAADLGCLIKPVCLEVFSSSYDRLSRIIISDLGYTMAVGVVKKIVECDADARVRPCLPLLQVIRQIAAYEGKLTTKPQASLTPRLPQGPVKVGGTTSLLMIETRASD